MKFALPITQAHTQCGVSACCKYIFKGALCATFFAFAIKFSTFNKVFRSRQFCGYLFRTACSPKTVSVGTISR